MDKQRKLFFDFNASLFLSLMPCSLIINDLSCLHKPNNEYINTMETQVLQPIKEIKVSLYPNPATDCVQISGIDGNVLLKISNLHCQTFLNKEIVDDEIICLKALPKGAYIAKITSSNGIIERKLVKK